jgi:hypothetical protein
MLKSSSLCLYSSNLGTFWLEIEQFWPFEEISIFSNGGHLGYRTALTDTILKGDHLNIISAEYGKQVKNYRLSNTNHTKSGRGDSGYGKLVENYRLNNTNHTKSGRGRGLKVWKAG